MIKYDDIGDDEIQIVTTKENETGKKPANKWVILIIVFVILLLVTLFYFIFRNESADKSQIEREPGYFEMLDESEDLSDVNYEKLFIEEGNEGNAFCEMADTLIDTVSVRLFHPVNATPSLHVGALGTLNTSDIVFAVQAADIRADNGKIVGAFVQHGQPLAWGLSKKGFCAIINDQFTIGMSDDTPLFDEAIQSGGHFFRQYPLLHQGVVMTHPLVNATTRRALCERKGEIFVAESLTPVSMDVFSHTLSLLGVDNAIYLVGSYAWGWATDANGERHEFGLHSNRLPRNVSYLIWSR